MVVARNQLQEIRRVRAANHDFAHVRDVEESCSGADRAVLFGKSGVLHGQLETGKRDHPATGDQMLFIQGRPLEMLDFGHVFPPNQRQRADYHLWSTLQGAVRSAG